MAPVTHSLADLARLADVTPRTIRYYVAQGLLPSPESAGPATRYGDGHLVRLRLIRRLQRDHLPLSEIRTRLERMGDEEVQAYLAGSAGVLADPPQSGAATLSYVQALMTQAGVPPRVSAGVPSPSYLAAPVLAAPTLSAPGATSSGPLAPLRPVAGDRSTWERHVLSADVELHVRRPLDRIANKRVDQLTRIARELFDEES